MNLRRLTLPALLLTAFAVGLYAQTTVLNPASDLAGKTLVTAEGNRTISGTFTYSVPVLFPTGTAGAPGVVSSTDQTSGWRLGLGLISGSLTGVQRFLLDGSGLTIYGVNVIDNTGAIGTAALGSGSATSASFLRGDRVWTALSTVAARGCDVRLTASTGIAVTTSDVTAAVNVFVTPYTYSGGPAFCAFYDGSATWTAIPVTEVTVAVPATTSTMYDVYCFNNGGTLACDAAVAWTNDTTRATALATQNGVYVKSGTTTRRFMGSFRTTTVAGQTESSCAKAYVWSYYNRVDRCLRVTDATASWTYSTATIRQANGAAANQVDLIVGVAEVTLDLTLQSMPVVNNSGIATVLNLGIGEDTTSAFTIVGFFTSNGSAALQSPTPPIRLVKMPAVGRHFYSWNEYSQANATTTWYGNSTVGSGAITTGLTGKYPG